MAEVLTIGETMVLMSPKERGYLHYVKDYEMKIAGAESNLAVGVSKLGHSAEWISNLGEDEFGMVVQNAVRAEGVHTEHVTFMSEYRTGLMFKQMQSAETAVFYYRENSAASHMCAEQVTDEMIKDCKILHLTGITPVLSESCEQMIWKAMETAEKNHVMISFDPNVRRKLWKDKDYSSMLGEMTMRADIVMLGIDEGKALFGVEDPEDILNRILEQGKAQFIALKNGAKGAIVADRKQHITIAPYPCQCVDPIGAGDAFNAGFLCGILEGRGLEECGKMGAIAGAMATENNGDIEGYPTRKQLENRLHENQEVYR